MTVVVRSRAALSSVSWIAASVRLSNALVASSRTGSADPQAVRARPQSHSRDPRVCSSKSAVRVLNHRSV